MNRFSILIVEVLIFLSVLGLRIYLHKKRMKKILHIEMKRNQVKSNTFNGENDEQ